jgi:MYXO-CTERM domain-containing protein
VIVMLDASCAITDEPSLVEASQSTLAGPGNRRRRSGCCGAQAAPDSPVALSLLVLAALFVLRRRR